MPHQKKRRGNPSLTCKPLTAYNRALASAISSVPIPDSDRLLGYLRSRRYDRLLEWAERPSPQLYDSAAEYYAEAQLAALIRKYPFTPDVVPGIDPEAAALQKFLSAEHKCKWQNRWLQCKRRTSSDVRPFWAIARSYIQNVIGDRPDLDHLYGLCDFTTGAALGVHGNATNVIRKLYAESWSVTPDALRHAVPALWACPQYRDIVLPGRITCLDPADFFNRVMAKVQLVDYNKISFVPKTAKTHRSIAVEPLLNGFVQKGADVYLRQCLNRNGIDLSDQTVNQALARMGTLSGNNPWCTIDLSAASDSLSFNVVKDLLPWDWFTFLGEIRSPGYRIDNSETTTVYEKFCSMGNGFCFPLQTLVFASVCYAAKVTLGDENPYEFSVYGDDILVRQSEALLVIEMLKELGFRTNVEKTFIAGPFRESCGADWYEGQDVRPVHLDTPLTEVRQLYSLHNSCYRSPIAERLLEEFRVALRKLAPEHSLLRPGREPGEGAFSVPLDLAMSCPSVRWNRAAQCWSWKEVFFSPVTDVYRLDEVEFAKTLVIAALTGANPRQPFTLRHTSTEKVRLVTKPFWDCHHKVLPRFLCSSHLESKEDVVIALRAHSVLRRSRKLLA